MKGLRGLACSLLLPALCLTGCTVQVNNPEPLLNVTGRTIQPGTALALTFTPEAGREVTINVQASTDLANPDVFVVEGERTFDEFDDIPIGQFAVRAESNAQGQEIETFTAEISDIYTLFVVDDNSITGARFSVSVTQD